MISIKTLIQSTALAAGALTLVNNAQAAMSRDEFLQRMSSEDPNERYPAWTTAQEQSPEIIEEIGSLLTSSNIGIADHARYAIERVVHSVGKDADDPNRPAVVEQLMNLLNHPAYDARVFAMRMLALVAKDDVAPTIGRWLNIPNIRDEAIACLEQIPGRGATEAIMEELKRAPADFHARMVTALGFRRDDAALELLAEYVESDNIDTALAAMKAITRIGKIPRRQVNLPSFEALNSRQKRQYIDCALRFCDGRSAVGDYDLSLDWLRNIYRGEMLDEEPVITAAVVSLSLIPRASAASLIIEALDHKYFITRDAAEKALIAMQGTAAENTLRNAYDRAEGDKKDKLKAILDARG